MPPVDQEDESIILVIAEEQLVHEGQVMLCGLVYKHLATRVIDKSFPKGRVILVFFPRDRRKWRGVRRGQIQRSTGARHERRMPLAPLM